MEENTPTPQDNLTAEQLVAPHDERCAERAGKTFYWEVDGVPVKEVYNDTGTGSRRSGLRDGEWVLGYPGNASFYQNAQSISKEEFDRLSLS